MPIWLAHITTFEPLRLFFFFFFFFLTVQTVFENMLIHTQLYTTQTDRVFKKKKKNNNNKNKIKRQLQNASILFSSRKPHVLNNMYTFSILLSISQCSHSTLSYYIPKLYWSYFLAENKYYFFLHQKTISYSYDTA